MSHVKRRWDQRGLGFRIVFLLGVLLTLIVVWIVPGVARGGAAAQGAAENDRARGESSYRQAIDDDAERDYKPDYLHLAWAQPEQMDGLPQYPWIFSPLESIGHTIASYQNYGGNPYFHHGIDSRAPAGTHVYTHSGGQIVNIENYVPGNDLYWEVAVLDPDGFLWQYHHIDVDSIPQYVWDKYDEYLADPITGGFVSGTPPTHLGDIVFWTVITFGEYFHHIHLNIYDGNGDYYNGFQLHETLPDTQAPEVVQIGLLQGGQILPGDEVVGDYSVYVRAQDLIMHNQFQVPPYETVYSVDGGPEETTWRFDGLPGGANNQAYVTELFVPPTCGNYECREFYIDLGFAVGPDRPFPSEAGEHSVTVTLRDFVGNETSDTFAWTVLGPPSGTIIWEDDFETDKGWVTDPFGSDTATTGHWGRGNPEETNQDGPKQLGTTVSGSYDMVTDWRAGSSAGSYDVDDGVTSVRSPNIVLPAGGDLTLAFYYYLAHTDNSSPDDFLRVKVVGTSTSTVLEQLGAANNRNGTWQLRVADVSSYAGQAVYVLIEAADSANGSIVEAAIDDLVILAPDGTLTATPTSSATATEMPTETATPTVTETPTQTATPTATSTGTTAPPSATPGGSTQTPTATYTPTSTATPTNTPTSTATPSPTQMPATDTPTPSPTPVEEDYEIFLPVILVSLNS